MGTLQNHRLEPSQSQVAARGGLLNRMIDRMTSFVVDRIRLLGVGCRDHSEALLPSGVVSAVNILCATQLALGTFLFAFATDGAPARDRIPPMCPDRM